MNKKHYIIIGVVALLILAILIPFWIANKKAKDRHQERIEMINEITITHNDKIDSIAEVVKTKKVIASRKEKVIDSLFTIINNGPGTISKNEIDSILNQLRNESK